MDTQAEYEAGKSISELTVDEWNEFRARKCIWPEEKLEWRRFRNFDISELKRLIISYSEGRRVDQKQG